MSNEMEIIERFRALGEDIASYGLALPKKADPALVEGYRAGCAKCWRGRKSAGFRGRSAGFRRAPERMTSTARPAAYGSAQRQPQRNHEVVWRTKEKTLESKQTSRQKSWKTRRSPKRGGIQSPSTR